MAIFKKLFSSLFGNDDFDEYRNITDKSYPDDNGRASKAESEPEETEDIDSDEEFDEINFEDSDFELFDDDQEEGESAKLCSQAEDLADDKGTDDKKIVEILEQAKSKSEELLDYLEVADTAADISKEKHETLTDDYRQFITAIYKDLLDRINDLMLEEDMSESWILCEICKSITNTLEDRNWVESLYKRILGNMDDVDDYCRAVSDIHSNNENEEKTKELFQKIIDKVLSEKDKPDSTADMDLTTIAGSILDVLEDRQWAKEIYQQALTISEKDNSIISLSDIADSIMQSYHDEKWAEEIYQKAEKNLSSPWEYCIFSNSLVYSYEDKEWARKVLQNGLNLSKNCQELCDIANGVLYGLHDKKWGEKILKNAMKKADSVEELCRVSNLYHGGLKDDSQAKNLLEKAIRKARNSIDYSLIGNAVFGVEKDESKARSYFEKAIDKTKDVNDYLFVACSVSENFNDREWGKEIFQKAIETVKDNEDLEQIAESVEDALLDSRWAEEIRKMKS